MDYCWPRRVITRWTRSLINCAGAVVIGRRANRRGLYQRRPIASSHRTSTTGDGRRTTETREHRDEELFAVFVCTRTRRPISTTDGERGRRRRPSEDSLQQGMMSVPQDVTPVDGDGGATQQTPLQGPRQQTRRPSYRRRSTHGAVADQRVGNDIQQVDG